MTSVQPGVRALDLFRKPAPAPPLAYEPLPAAPRLGMGRAFGHNGELLQGAFRDVDGKLRRGLITLPCRRFEGKATFRPRRNGPVTVQPAWKSLSATAAELAIAELDLPWSGGELVLSSETAVSRGLGTSTSDVTAAIRAVAAAWAADISPGTVARLAVAAERASDSIMFCEGDHAVLFAQREGVVIESFAPSSPPIEVLGFDTATGSDGVDTLAFAPARYRDDEIEQFSVLLAACRRAFSTADVALLGKVATASARINQSRLATNHAELIDAVAVGTGAAGWQVAHTGTVAGLIYDQRDPLLDLRLGRAAACLADHGLRQQWRFRWG